MARRRRSVKVKLNTKLMMDVVSAGLIVRNLPKLINNFIQLDPMISTVAAVGGGYMAGVFFKRPDLANAAIAVGIAQFVDPFIDNLIGQGGIPIAPGAPGPQGIAIGPPGPVPEHRYQTVDDYFSLNDYINDPSGSMPARVYADSY